MHVRTLLALIDQAYIRRVDHSNNETSGAVYTVDDEDVHLHVHRSAGAPVWSWNQKYLVGTVRASYQGLGVE
jgi:hypothetical protein